jgi:tetratricopeptide (TPR) repeat protein
MATPAAHPDAFWGAVDMQEALKSQDFGRILRAYREAHQPVLNQATVGQWIGLTQGQVSRIERSATPAHDLNKLRSWARALGIPEKHLWFRYPDGPPKSKEQRQAGTGACTDSEDSQGRHLLTGLSTALQRTLSKRDGLTFHQQVDAPNIDFMRETVRNFRRLDNRFGGGYGRTMVASYLASDVGPILKTGGYPSTLQRDFFTAAAELYQLAGWMAYDTGDAVDGHRCLREALCLCQDASNDSLAAEMLAAMSHHAGFGRSAEMAIDLALAARQKAAKAGPRNLRAEIATLEAHGLALQGDARGCIAALQRAEQSFIDPASADSPPWLSYFDEAYLAAKFAHALRDLGRPADAERFARRSLAMTDGYERGRLFNTALLASILADQGKVEEAVSHALLAVRMAGSMRSRRVVSYLTDVGRRLLPYRDAQEVRALHAQMTVTGFSFRESLVDGLPGE